MKAPNNIAIREIKQSELGILEDMLYEAIYQPDRKNLIPRSVLNIPEVNAYIRDFGKEKADYCLVADFEGTIIRAVWIRIISGDIKGYGYVDESYTAICYISVRRISQSRYWLSINHYYNRPFTQKWLQPSIFECEERELCSEVIPKNGI